MSAFDTRPAEPLPVELVHSPGLRPHDLVVALELALMTPGSVVETSIGELACRAGVVVRMVDYALAHLVRDGWVAWGDREAQPQGAPLRLVLRWRLDQGRRDETRKGGVS